LISLFEEQMKAVIDNMEVQISGIDDPAKRLERFASTHLDLIEKNQDMAEIIQVELRQSGKFMKEYKNEKFIQYLDIIEDIISEGQKEGIFRKDVIPKVAKRAFLGHWMRFPDFGYCQVEGNMISGPLQDKSANIF